MDPVTMVSEEFMSVYASNQSSSHHNVMFALSTFVCQTGLVMAVIIVRNKRQ